MLFMGCDNTLQLSLRTNLTATRRFLGGKRWGSCTNFFPLALPQGRWSKRRSSSRKQGGHSIHSLRSTSATQLFTDEQFIIELTGHIQERQRCSLLQTNIRKPLPRCLVDFKQKAKTDNHPAPPSFESLDVAPPPSCPFPPYVAMDYYYPPYPHSVGSNILCTCSNCSGLNSAAQ